MAYICITPNVAMVRMNAGDHLEEMPGDFTSTWILWLKPVCVQCVKSTKATSALTFCWCWKIKPTNLFSVTAPQAIKHATR